ncbi:MAG: hypothetical protein BWY76_01873 [bacterium ADurb.Bin429]|nr:MAG: hypothetical protein BWY76_01873 [bacterium ADurb.Bin429]
MIPPRAMNSIFERLVEIELTIGELYGRYAARFPATAEVWEGLQHDERRHADWLRSLQLQIQEKDANIGFDADRFSPTVLDAYLSIVRAALTESDGDTEAQAFHRAVAIEQSFVETRFYDVATGTHPTIARVFKALAEETKHHRARLAELAAGMG